MTHKEVKKEYLKLTKEIETMPLYDDRLILEE